MIATVAMGMSQYHHTVNTLKYADRAKEIKTHVRRNTASVAMHVAQMRAVILQLQQQNSALKSMLNSPAVSHLLADPWYGFCQLAASVAMHEAQMQAVILQLQQQNSALKSMLNSPAVSGLLLVSFGSATHCQCTRPAWRCTWRRCTPSAAAAAEQRAQVHAQRPCSEVSA